MTKRFFIIVLPLLGLGACFGSTPERSSVAQTTTNRTMTPLIDADAPKHIETATFALG